MSRYEPYIHRIYRQVRPVIQRLGLSALARRFFTPNIRQAVSRRLGLEGYAQSIPPEVVDETRRPARKFAFVFICQHGEIEVEALLLAISLKRFLRCEYELIAAVPTPAEIWGLPNPKTLDLLRSLDVRIQPIINPLDASFVYGNKIPCLKIETDANKLFYLDSDILLIRHFYDELRFDLPLSAKPTDVKRAVDIGGEWPEIYNAVGLQQPVQRRPTTVSKYIGFPQFNGGVICIDVGLNLAETWQHYINLVRDDERFTPDRLWSDQIGLALAIHKLGVDVDYLDEKYNYPLHHKRLHSGISPYFVHYHYPKLISEEPVLCELFHDFVVQYPQLREIMENKPEWEMLLTTKTVRSSVSKMILKRNRDHLFPELIITGIPGSGTSDLCHILQGYSNCLIINEPEDVQNCLLSDTAIPWGVGIYYREIRSKVISGKSIMNGHKGEHVPSVDNEHFILGTKNSAGILPHLQRLRRVMPEAQVVICVRNPFTTIASWKRSFSPNSDSEWPLSALGCADDPWVTEKHNWMLETINSEPHLPQKRAMLWHYFAELVLNEAPNATIVRYEDLIANPRAVTGSILKKYDKGKLRKPIYPPGAQTRHLIAGLDSEDIRAIRAICSQTAAELGVDMTSIY